MNPTIRMQGWMVLCLMSIAASQAHAQAQVTGTGIPALPEGVQVAPAKEAPKNVPSAPAPELSTPKAEPVDDGVKTYSFGTYPHSLFFTASQIAMMRLALTTAENRPGLDMVPEELEVADTGPAPPSEPTVYPVFFLDSIAYRSDKDWAVWVSGRKITPSTNSADMRVVSLDRREVVFVWSPEYTQALKFRNAQRSFAPTTSVSHRLVNAQKLTLDDSGIVTFTLSPNQSLATGYMAIFEGNMSTPSMPPVSGIVASASMSSVGGEAANSLAPNAGEGGLAQGAIDRMKADADKQLPTP